MRKKKVIAAVLIAGIVIETAVIAHMLEMKSSVPFGGECLIFALCVIAAYIIIEITDRLRPKRLPSVRLTRRTKKGKAVLSQAAFPHIAEETLIREMNAFEPFAVAVDKLCIYEENEAGGERNENPINRENVEWLVTNHRFDFDMIVIDELSSFKSHRSKRFRALRKVRPKAERIVGLTGTPAPNGLMDLWAEINILDMGKRLGRYITRFREAYFRPDKRNGMVIYTYKPLPDSEERIYDKLSDICISMKATDYLKMPDRVDNVVEVSMNSREAEMYKRLERDMLLPFADGDIDAANAAALSNKLLQMANGSVYDEYGETKQFHSRKLDALEDLIEAANGKPVLIYYSFKHDKVRIEKWFKAREIKTEKDMTDWNEGEISVALAHPASCGHGLNLQSGGSTIVWFGMTWSLELYQQANARLYRQGQKNTVVIHHIITKGTVDENVMQALQDKDIGQTALMNAVKAMIKEVAG